MDLSKRTSFQRDTVASSSRDTSNRSMSLDVLRSSYNPSYDRRHTTYDVAVQGGSASGYDWASNTHDASQSYWRTEDQSDSRSVPNWADSIANAADQSGSRKRNYWTYSTADVRQTSLSFSTEPAQEIPHQIFQERTGYLEDIISVRGSSSTLPQEISSQTAQNNPLGTQGRWYQEESSGTLWDGCGPEFATPT